MTDQIEAEVAHYLKRYNFGAPPGRDEDIFRIGTITSLVAMQLLLFIEKRWSIKIANSELRRENFETVGKIAALVNSHLSEVKAGS